MAITTRSNKSADVTSGFIIQTAGQGVISATGGGSINASVLNTKELYEIGVREISGSCTVHVIF